ncbi:MAG TPA: hypothetical protein VKB58_10335 [Terriglobales bacterium]|jgi:hypothetical protein|nr:hypothetical protein [Terriglobales bacterium]
MRKNNVAIEDAPAAPALTLDMVSKIKKDDMMQAVFERFSARTEAPRAEAARKRSPYWQPADDQC